MASKADKSWPSRAHVSWFVWKQTKEMKTKKSRTQQHNTKVKITRGYLELLHNHLNPQTSNLAEIARSR